MYTSCGMNMTFKRDIIVSYELWCTEVIWIMSDISWTNCETWNQPGNCEKVTERSASEQLQIR